MQEHKYTEETDEVVLDIINRNILRHTVQFFQMGEKRLEPFGSGVFAKIHNEYFIITASHVADFFEKNPDKDLRIRVGKKLFINVLGDIKYTDIDKSNGVDLAYIKLDNQMIEPMLRPYIPLETSKIRSHHNLLHVMNYCVLGFPEKNITKEDEEFNTGASFYLTGATNEKPYNHYKYDKKDYIIVDMQGKGTDIRTNKKEKIDIRFHGISGCGLWLLLINKPKNGKTQVDYRLVGIMTEYKNGKFFCLIANKIYLIIEALKVIENYKFKEIKMT
ncbi:hypothetical protein B0A56_03245 [Flavobacterium columnare NBRC 100251 = ATCC 23463]|nr:hypothetical protein B0A56_03245 [Flavobacterium columnare NBRC 100251 = ATCC 23463]